MSVSIAEVVVVRDVGEVAVCGMVRETFLAGLAVHHSLYAEVIVRERMAGDCAVEGELLGLSHFLTLGILCDDVCELVLVHGATVDALCGSFPCEVIVAVSCNGERDVVRGLRCVVAGVC